MAGRDAMQWIRFRKVHIGGETGRFLLYLLPVLIGTELCLSYISKAACDVVYSDYIRLIASYLPDVENPAHFLTPDVLTRIPASFLQRFLNVRLFGFSVTFDRVCGVLGLTLCGSVLAAYCARERVSAAIYLLINLVLFSLIKWEILLNGTAWAHVVSFGLFFLNYERLDAFYRGGAGKRTEISLCLLPFAILLFAGEYLASYAVVMLLAYGCLLFCAGRGGQEEQKKGNGAGISQMQSESGSVSPRRRVLLAGFFSTVSVLLLYLLSRHFAVFEHAGATTLGFSEAMREAPLFLPRFFLKTFAGAVLGQESIAALMEQGKLTDGGVLLLGLALLLAYFFALTLFFREKLFQKTVFPLFLLLSGGANHVLVTLSRWIFLKESYALSSRYAAQFMIGIIGILLVFGLWLRKLRAEQKKAPLSCGILLVFCIFILAGNCYTTVDEIRKAPYREANYEALAQLVRNYRNVPEETLREKLEWNKSAETMYRALSILEENHLNVFRER